MKTIEMLIGEIKASETLQKQLAEAAQNKTLDAFLKDQGCEATAEEFIAALKEQTEQMDDAALNAVAGGANIWETLMSSFFGLACVITYTVSVVESGGTGESGTGNGKNGKILCNSY